MWLQRELYAEPWNSLQRQGGPTKVFSAKKSHDPLVFREPTLLLRGEWTELHVTLAGQQQFKTLRGSRAPVATLATRKSVHLGQIPDAAAPKSIQAQTVSDK